MASRGRLGKVLSGELWRVVERSGAAWNGRSGQVCYGALRWVTLWRGELSCGRQGVLWTVGRVEVRLVKA